MLRQIPTVSHKHVDLALKLRASQSHPPNCPLATAPTNSQIRPATPRTLAVAPRALHKGYRRTRICSN